MSENQQSAWPIVIKSSLPALLSIILFMLLIFFLILPFINDALLNQKKESVKKLIESSYSLVGSIYMEYSQGLATEEDAQKKALALLEGLHYDEDMKNYFWVNTIEPDGSSIMIMHPYRTDLVGTDVLFLQDPYGVYIFRDMVGIVEESGEGFTAYHWQYMDSTDRIEKKISYVKLFEPWNWIIGTGLYLDDINRDIARITRDTGRYVLLVFCLIVFLLGHNSLTSIRAEREKNAARSYLGSVIELLPSALFNCDGEWIVRSCNARAGILLDADPDTLKDKSLIHILPGFGEIAGTREGLFERRAIEADGKRIIANITVFAVNREGFPPYVVLIDDITGQVQKENQLMQSQKMETVGNLVGGIAHDFNNIIGGIIGTTSLLTMKCDEFETLTREELLEYVSLIDEAGERAADMIQQLLSLARKQETRFSPFDLNLSIRHIHKMCLSSFDKSLEIRAVTPETPSLSRGNNTMIEQVLLNLCVNASHAMTFMRPAGSPRGGKLDLELEKIGADREFRREHPEAPEEEYWRITVKDSGVGIEKEDLSRIFEPFFTTKAKNEGTGLGLSMVYNIVKQHKGFIDIDSEKGRGTTVRVYLPVLSGGEGVKADVPADEKLVSGSGTVLVIDDDKLIRHLVSQILKNCGYRILKARDGVEGIRTYRKHRDRIDLVFLDLIMPRKSGLEVYYALKEMDDSVRILLSSGYRQDERVKEIMEKGVNGFIQKPFSPTELTRQVRRILTDEA